MIRACQEQLYPMRGETENTRTEHLAYFESCASYGRIYASRGETYPAIRYLARAYHRGTRGGAKALRRRKCGVCLLWYSPLFATYHFWHGAQKITHERGLQ